MVTRLLSPKCKVWPAVAKTIIKIRDVKRRIFSQVYENDYAVQT